MKKKTIDKIVEQKSLKNKDYLIIRESLYKLTSLIGAHCEKDDYRLTEPLYLSLNNVLDELDFIKDHFKKD